jgi:hypothetical protein
MSRQRRPNIHPVVLSREPLELSGDEKRLILGVEDVMVYEAGRTTLALALRGSRNQKLARFKVDDLAGNGMAAHVERMVGLRSDKSAGETRTPDRTLQQPRPAPGRRSH